MGLDINSLNFLGFSKNQGVDFSKTLSIGRAGICMTEDSIRDFLIAFGRADLVKDIQRLTKSKYFEEILAVVFGAKQQDSVDASSYEGASIVHDFNLPIETDKRFTAIIDFGCLEHVFNFPVAIDNIINLCDVNGHILHYLPANNCCGHGFYQFSPELFFSLYSAERGFSDTQVFFVEWKNDPSVWYEIKSPAELHQRVNISNTCEGYLLVKTRKLINAVSPLECAPQQSDYVSTWKGDEVIADRSNKNTISKYTKSIIKMLMKALGLEKQIEKVSIFLWYRTKMIRRKRPDLVRQKVSDLLKRPSLRT